MQIILTFLSSHANLNLDSVKTIFSFITCSRFQDSMLFLRDSFFVSPRFFFCFSKKNSQFSHSLNLENMLQPVSNLSKSVTK